MAGKVADINSSQFGESVRSSDVPVLVDFWAPWCGPCRAIGPVIEQLADEYDGRAKFVKVNVDENQDLAQEFSVMSIPMLLIFKDGEAKDQIMGARPKDMIAGVLDRHVTAAAS